MKSQLTEKVTHLEKELKGQIEESQKDMKNRYQQIEDQIKTLQTKMEVTN
jgi:gas vesicle protein